MERAKSLTLPNGRRLHVAEDHDHVEELRNILGDNGEFNITIHGSPEHVREFPMRIRPNGISSL